MALNNLYLKNTPDEISVISFKIDMLIKQILKLIEKRFINYY
jgi:hypothetical protein